MRQKKIDMGTFLLHHCSLRFTKLYQFQIKDDLKAARIEAARRTEAYVEQPKTSQRREGLDMELELDSPGSMRRLWAKY